MVQFRIPDCCSTISAGGAVNRPPDAIQNPFYLLAPTWALYPLLILSTLATVIASQAWSRCVFGDAAAIHWVTVRVWTFYTRQVKKWAGLCSAVNWLLMVSVFVLVLSFKSSSRLHALTYCSYRYNDSRHCACIYHHPALWHWTKITSVTFLSTFLAIDFCFFSSNSLKYDWRLAPVGRCYLLFLLLTTWIKGRALLTAYMDERRTLFEDLEEKINAN